MNLLQLVNEVRREASVAGATIPTVLNATGETARLVRWVQRSYTDIQNEYFDWLFLKKSGTFETVSGENTVLPPDDLNIWDEQRFYDASGNWIEAMEYSRLDYKLDTTLTGKPDRIYINPDNSLLLDRTPDAVYEYSYDYFRVPFEMTADTDTPAFPEQFHQAIVGRALVYYGNYEAAVEIKQQGAEIFQFNMDRLRRNQLPDKQQFYGRSDSAPIQIRVQ